MSILTLQLLFSFLFGLSLADHLHPSHRKCGSFPINPAAEEQIKAASLYAASAATKSRRTVIPVHWHTITDDKRVGAFNESQIASQIRVLNHGFARTGFSFVLNSTDTTVNNTWFYNTTPGDNPDLDAMKSSLHKGTLGELNIFTVNLTRGIVGFATPPYLASGTPELDAIVMHHNTVPGGTWGRNFSMGKTAIHETGHWLGLYHLWEGGCNDDNGDYVDDTPPQATPTFGCPKFKDTCPSDGVDLVHNYMDYSFDSCLNSFTPGQIARMHTVSSVFRGM